TARTEAETVLMALRRGEDPRRNRCRTPLESDQAKLFGAVAETFITQIVRRTMRRPVPVEARIRRDLLARWKDRPIAELQRRDIVAMLDAVLEASGPESARTTLNYCRRLFKWAMQRDIYDLEHNVVLDLSAKDLVGSPHPRDRVLDDGELRLIWNAAGS